MRAFDWADDDDGNPGTAPNVPRLARMVRDERVAAPAKAFALYPRTNGNIHVFTAVEPSAVLDILSPPYAIGAVATATTSRRFRSVWTGAGRRRGTRGSWRWTARTISRWRGGNTTGRGSGAGAGGREEGGARR